MALIKCKKCGNEISSTCYKCIHCNKKRNPKWVAPVVISAIIFSLFIIVAAVALVAGSIYYSASYVDGEYSYQVDYYEKNSEKYICSVKTEIILDDKSFSYDSNVVKGNCEYDKVHYRGDYELGYINFDEDDTTVDVTYKTNGVVNRGQIIYRYGYIIFEDSNYNIEYFFDEDDKNYSTKKYLDSDVTDNNIASFKDIKFNELLNSDITTKKSVVLIGSVDEDKTTVQKNLLLKLKEEYDLELFFLNYDELSTIELATLQTKLNDNISKPVTLIFNNNQYQLMLSNSNENQMRDALKSLKYYKDQII